MTFINNIFKLYYHELKVNKKGSMSNNVGDNLNQ